MNHFPGGSSRRERRGERESWGRREQEESKATANVNSKKANEHSFHAPRLKLGATTATAATKLSRHKNNLQFLDGK